MGNYPQIYHREKLQYFNRRSKNMYGKKKYEKEKGMIVTDRKIYLNIAIQEEKNSLPCLGKENLNIQCQKSNKERTGMYLRST